MKKIWKENAKLILAIFVTVVIASGATYAATTMYDSNTIGYDNTTSGLRSTNVQSALDELYGNVAEVILNIKSIIGNSTLTTTDQTLTGGINELNDQIGNVWHDITNDCTWNTTYVSNYSAYYNSVAKQVFVYGVVSAGVPNQTALVTLNKNVLFLHVISRFYDLNSNPPMTIEIVARTDNTIRSSHSVNRNSSAAYALVGVVAVSD